MPYGATDPERSEQLTANDRERAEAVVRELEDLDLYPPRRPSSIVAALRHPLVVGALLAILSGVFASVLIPSLTRVWQDRPKELALKRTLVERISREATQAIDGAVVGRSVSPNRRQAFYSRLISRWRVESSVIGSQLTTYFKQSIGRRWRNYAGVISSFLQEVAFSRKRDFSDESGIVRGHFKQVRFEDGSTEQLRKNFVRGETGDTMINVLLLEERDQLTSDLVDAQAAGFSHGL